MRTKAILFGAITLFFQFIFTSSAEAGWTCGIPSYQATVSINAKICATNFGGTKRCDNNGPWRCNGTYQCNGFSGGGAKCHRATNPASCEVGVYATANCVEEDCNTGCNISPDGFTCNETKTTQNSSCMVFTPDTTPTSTPIPTPTPTQAVGCGTCSDNGQCLNSCNLACGWCSNGGSACRWSNNCSTPPTDQAPIGHHDAPNNASCTLLGWACDQDLWNDKINVHFYEGANYIGSYVAQDVSPDVNSSCGNTPNHRFNYVLPMSYNSGSLYNGLPHSITAYALGVNSSGVENGNNPSLMSNPRTVTCACPVPATPPVPSVVSACSATSAVSLTWTGGPYNVYREGTVAPIATNQTSGYTDNAVSCGSSYRYKLRSTAVCGAISESAWSASVVALCNPGTPTISSIDSATSVPPAYGGMNIAWNNVANETGYRVYAGNPPPGGPPPVAVTAQDITTTTLPNSLCTGSNSSYYVQAYNNTCTANSAVTQGGCVPYPNWFQTTGGNVTSGGSIDSAMPINEAFATGVVTYAGSPSTLNDGSGTTQYTVGAGIADVISTNTFNSIAGVIKSKVTSLTQTTGPNTFNQAEVNTGGVTYGDAKYYEYGTLNLGSSAPISVPNNTKIVVIANSTVTISNNITLGTNSNFVLIANGSITIANGVGTALGGNPKTSSASLQGIYFTAGTINTGAGGSGTLASGYRSLRLEGSFVGRSGVTLNRFNTGTYPGEYFVFRPEYVLAIPEGMKSEGRVFEEVAP